MRINPEGVGRVLPATLGQVEIGGEENQLLVGGEGHYLGKVYPPRKIVTKNRGPVEVDAFPASFV